MTASTYDLIIIGAGSGGLTAAGFAARLGARTALIEKDRIGGDCTWTGCVPSKALLKAAKIAHHARTSSRFGIQCGPVTVDMKQVKQYVESAIAEVYRHETPESLKQTGIDVIAGAPRFRDAHTLQIGNETLASNRFLITTGAHPVVPNIPGLAGVSYFTYERLFENDRLPDRLAVIGGGPIGMEMAQAYQRLGSQVTVVTDSVLPKDDVDARSVIRTIFEGEGVKFNLGRVTAVRKSGAEVIVESSAGEVRADSLLVAVGRAPNVDELDLEKAGVAYSRKGIAVDDRLRTSVKHIYAAGDVIGGYQFTHYAAWQSFQAVRNALLPGSVAARPDLVPWVTYTDPEVAQVGLTAARAAETFGKHVRISFWDAGRIDRAVCEGDLCGFLKIVSADDGRILGATMVAERAGEAISEIAVAMQNRLKVKHIAGAIHPYPTYSTALQQASAELAVAQTLGGFRGKLIRTLLTFAPG